MVKLMILLERKEPKELQTDKENEKAKAVALRKSPKMNELIFGDFLCGGRHPWCRRTVVLQLLPCNTQRYHFQSFLECRTFFSKKVLRPPHPTDKYEFILSKFQPKYKRTCFMLASPFVLHTGNLSAKQIGINAVKNAVFIQGSRLDRRISLGNHHRLKSFTS